MKHAYILDINEMRAAIAGHYDVSVNDVTIHAFPDGKQLRIEARVAVEDDGCIRNCPWCAKNENCPYNYIPPMHMK